jgi:hypothetical protein
MACGAQGHYYPEQRHSKFMLTVRSLVVSSSSIPPTVSGKTCSITSIPLEGDVFAFLTQEVLAAHEPEVVAQTPKFSILCAEIARNLAEQIESEEILCFS